MNKFPRPKTTTIFATLTSNVEIKKINSKTETKQIARATTIKKNGQTVRITTTSPEAISYLDGKKAGESIHVSGTWIRENRNITFSVIKGSVQKLHTKTNGQVTEAKEKDNFLS